MKRLIQFSFSALLMAGLVACSSEDRADPNNANAANKPVAPAPAAPAPAPVKVVIPQGTQLKVALIDGVSTTKSAPGDTFTASLVEPVVVDGRTVLEKGTSVRGRVVDVAESGRVKGRASIELRLTDIVRNGKNVPITTKTFVAVAQGTKKRDAEVVGGGAGIGTLIGAIAGGGKGAAIGAAVGGGAGAGTVLATKGKELHYPPETRLNFTLSSSVEM